MSTFHTIWLDIVAGKSDIWSAIIGGAVGAAIASIAAIWAGWRGAQGAMKAAMISANQARDDNAARDKRAQLDSAIAFVQSIQAEVQGLWVALNADIFPKIRSADAKGYGYNNLIGHHYFVVYVANARLLGSVDDAALRKCIVALYIKAMSFVDTLTYNSRLAVLSDEAARGAALADGARAAVLQWDHSVRASRLAAYLEVLRQSLQALDGELDRFWDLSNRWLEQKDAKTNPPPQMIGGGTDPEPMATYDERPPRDHQVFFVGGDTPS